MLIGIIILTMYVLSVLYAAYSGSAAQAGSAVLEGAGAAVSFCLSIGGAVCLWSAAAFDIMPAVWVSSAASLAAGIAAAAVMKRLWD